VEETINQFLETPYQLEMSAKHITCTALTLGYFPAQWKVAQIILLLKPGKPPHELTSYRPISLLPIVSKVFEKILMHRLLPMVDTNKNIPDHQFGFRKRHSTIEQTHRVVRRIHEAFETKQYCSAAFLDISQASDEVWHTGLQYKIRQFLPLNYFLLIKSYLQNGHFLVKVANEYSDLTPVNAGVPQGSVLGPLLYVLYTADLPTSDGKLTATFADDTAILTTDSDPTVASQLLKTNLLAIRTWLKTWRLKVNEIKSTHVTFTTRRTSCPPVFINSVQLPQADDVKYLGLYLDRKLTWNKHILTKRKQLGRTLTKMHWLLGRQSQLFTTNKLLLYKTILKPIWTYGIQLWDTASTSNIEILERFQAKVLRMIVKTGGMSRMLSSERISTFQQSRKKSAFSILTMKLGSALIQILSSKTYCGCQTTDASNGICPTNYLLGFLCNLLTILNINLN
jgi:hypothetical protein